MLFEFSELDWMFDDSEGIESFLSRIIDLIYKHMNISSCSIHLLDDKSEQLVFMASKQTGNNIIQENSCDLLHLKKNEGLCGRALESGKIEYATRRRRSMAVPIRRRNHPIGVLLLERKKRPFSLIDAGTIQVLASQTANILENARSYFSEIISSGLETTDNLVEFDTQILLNGNGASPGHAFAESFTLDRKRSFKELKKLRFEKIYTWKELETAILDTEDQLIKLQHTVEENLSDSASLIFTSHLMILKDKNYINEIRSLINTGLNPPTALLNVTENYIKIFSESDAPFVREKAEDLEDLVQRIFSNLLGEESVPVRAENRIVIAKKLYPSEILTLASEKAAGILLVSGGVTAHISILAQSLKIPMVIIDYPDLIKTNKPLPTGIDGSTGKIIINPEPEIMEEFIELQRLSRQTNKENLNDETRTKCGKKINLLTNINLIPDLEEAVKMNAEGVGLYRTEFPFMLRNNFPSEEEQFAIYKQIIDLAADRPITFRTLDVGGDKGLSYWRGEVEENPFLGLRSIRFSLSNPLIFRTQIRAILRAAGSKKIKLMFPMISSMEELRSAKELVMQAWEGINADGEETAFPEIGAMVEIPSILAIIDNICEEVDFLSIGTNDFIQYMLAVDRNNEKLKSYYTPHHPSILRALKMLSDTSKTHNVGLTVCGEMAHQKEYVPFLLGIGIENLSVSTSFLNVTQEIISNIKLGEARTLADEVLKHSSIYEIERTLGIL